MQNLTEFIKEGRKQKIANYKALEKEALKVGERYSTEYLKYILDTFMSEVLWKYPEIKFKEDRVEDIEMGYSHIPAKLHFLTYDYKGNELIFRINSFFADIFTDLFVNKKNVTHDITDSYGDIVLGRFMSDRGYISRYKALLDGLNAE